MMAYGLTINTTKYGKRQNSKRKYVSIYMKRWSHARLVKGQVMFFAFAYKGGSLRASFDGLGEVVETSHGTVLESA